MLEGRDVYPTEEETGAELHYEGHNWKSKGTVSLSPQNRDPATGSLWRRQTCSRQSNENSPRTEQAARQLGVSCPDTCSKKD